MAIATSNYSQITEQDLQLKQLETRKRNFENDITQHQNTIHSIIRQILVLKKGGDVPAFEKPLDQAVGEKAEVKSLVSKRSLEVRDLDETVTREEVVAALCIALGKPDLGNQCRLYKRFGGVQTTVVRLTDADARSLLGLGQVQGIWPCVARLLATRQEGCLLEVWGRVARGQGVQGSPSVPDLHR